MKVKRKAGPPLGPWDIAAFVMAGLLYLDVLCFLILTVAGIGLLLVYALECGIVTGVLLLLGMFLYFLGKSRGMGKLSRRLLLGGLIAGGVLLLLFALAVGGAYPLHRYLHGRAVNFARGKLWWNFQTTSGRRSWSRPCPTSRNTRAKPWW